MPVNKNVLIAALGQLSQKYRGKGGVINVTVQMISGSPAFIMHGAAPKPPDGLPGRMTVPDDTGRPVAVPVLWNQRKDVPLIVPSVRAVAPAAGNSLPMSPDRPVTAKPHSNDEDVDRSMWRGFTPIDRRDVIREYQPGSETIATQMAIPEAITEELRVSVDITGTWGWWTKAFDVQGCLCCTYYATPVAVLSYTEQQDWQLTIDGWSFFVYGNFFVGDTFNVRFVRDGETILEYDEIIVDPTNADPAKRCLFSGSTDQPMNSYLRIDRNQTLVVYITVKGLAPFAKGPLDPFCGTICCLLHGHRTALLDNRDGAPRPKDVGALRDNIDCTGLIEQVTPGDLAQLMHWLDNATADAAPPNLPIRDIDPSTTAAVIPVTAKDPGKGNAIIGGVVTAAMLAAATLGEDLK
jgi:hypothetical protein